VSYSAMGRSFGAAADCAPGEFFDEPSGECLCKPGLTPSPVVGGGCVAVKTGGTTGDTCLMKGMDYDIATQKCIPRCPPGQGRDVSGNCVSLVAWDTAHGITPAGGGGGGGGGQPAAETPEQVAKASFPWVAGAAVGIVAIALIAAMTGKSAPSGGSRSSGGQRYAANKRRAKKRRHFLNEYFLVYHEGGRAKDYSGPYASKKSAVRARAAERRKYGLAASRYRITQTKPW